MHVFLTASGSVSSLREKRPTTAGETALRLSPLSFRCSHHRRCPSFLHTCLSLHKSKVCKNLFEKSSFVFLQCAKQLLAGGQLWTSVLAPTFAARMDSYHNNTYNDNICYEALVVERGCGEVSLEPTESSTRWLLPFMCC